MAIDINDDLGNARMPGVPNGAGGGSADPAGYDLDLQSAGSLFITGAISGDTLAQIVDSLCMAVVSCEDSIDREWAKRHTDAVLAEVLGRSRAVHG